MPYVPTTWVDGTTAITATQLNRIETGVKDAHDVLPAGGRVFDTSGVPTFIGPTGWTVTRMSLGRFRITHNIGSVNYNFVAMTEQVGSGSTYVYRFGLDVNYFEVRTYWDTGSGPALADIDFSFVLVRFA